MLWRPFLMGFIIAILVSPAAADAKRCITVESDLDRLACYDKEAGRTPVVEALASALTGAQWNVRKETSAMTDRANVYIHVESNEVINCGWNSGARIRMVARCMENTTALIFQTGCHMTSSRYNSYGDIQYRIDSEPARTVSGDESTNNRALGLWNGGASIPVIEQMFGKSQLIAKMTPFSENPFTATFDITGIEEAITPLREACGW